MLNVFLFFLGHFYMQAFVDAGKKRLVFDFRLEIYVSGIFFLAAYTAQVGRRNFSRVCLSERR